MNRSEQIDRLKSALEWDIVIIGGGANGLGTALDAASRGYKTILFEASDFAKGTSSRSTKLAHGGVRYLAQGNLFLVIEALRERGLMLKNANHLVKNQSFVIPIYHKWLGYFYAFGLKIYDLLAINYSFGQSKLISKNETISYLPNINKKGLKNGVLYYDGQFDDSRLAINLAQTAIEKGACIINYFKVTELLKNKDNKIIGVKVTDQETLSTYSLNSKIVINATGVFTNSIMKLNDLVYKKYVVPSQGIHLVFDSSFLAGQTALMIPKTTDSRVLFIVPWNDKVIIGTTDTLIENESLEPRALESEIDFVLQNAQFYLENKPTKADIKSIYAGLRPLAAPNEKNQNTKEISRSHKILLSETGLITITGGKWTTYRKIAQDAIDTAIKTNKIPKQKCLTKKISIHGNFPDEFQILEQHFSSYGSDLPLLQQLQEEEPHLKEKLHKNYNYLLAEVVWAIRNEMARTVDDVLARRVRLLFLDAKAAIDCADKVAKIIAFELNYDENWIKNEVSNFTKIAEGFLIKSNDIAIK